jgi:hypothetical protein
MSNMRKSPQRPKMPKANVLAAKVQKPIVEKDFKVVRQECDNIVRKVLESMKIDTWGKTFEFLCRYSVPMFNGNLPPEERKTFGTLIELRRRHKQPEFDPSEFLDSSGRIPLRVLMDCAIKCRTREKLKESVFNPSTPRGDMYIAYILGLITKEEFETLQPRIDKKPLRKKILWNKQSKTPRMRRRTTRVKNKSMNTT